MEHLSVVTDPVSAPGLSFGLGRAPIKYVLDNGATRDFSQGAIEQTGGTFDVAIEGKGFFSVQTANGVRYTRDGRFTTDAQNRIVDAGRRSRCWTPAARRSPSIPRSARR